MILPSVSFKTLSGVMIAVLVLMGAVLWICAVGIQGKVSSTDAFWRQYQDTTAPKGVAMEKIVASLGYGGMIDNYTRYVLRKDEQFRSDVMASAGEALGAINDYRAAGATPAEESALATLEQVVRDYRARIAEVDALIGANLDAATIHDGIVVNDQPALDAIATLQAAVRADKHGDANSHSRTEILAQIRAALGFGGMIHLFRDALLDRDENRVVDILTSIASAREGVEALRTLGVNPVEEEALTAIEDVIAHYEQNTSVAAEMFSTPATVEEIDAVVAIPDGPALQGFMTLERELAARYAGERDSVSRNLSATQWLSYAIIGVAVISSTAMIALVVWIQVFRMVRPVRAITGIMKRLSSGDLHLSVPGLDRHDEIGQMAAALEVFREGLIKAESLAQAEREQQEEKARQTQHLENLLRDFDLAMISVLESLGEADSAMKVTAGQMTEGAEGTRREASTVSDSAEQVTSNVEAVASAAEELSSSISEIARQVAQASSVARRAVEETHETSDKLRTLEETVERIDAVVALITDIAGQTNLLALNATIEAARAGEMGKGFAVVAGEVKQLAGQTARATEDIRRQIQEVQNATRDSVQSMANVGGTIREVDDISASIAAAVEEQGAATREIARNVEQTAQDTKDVTRAIDKVREAAENTDRGARAIEEASIRLSEQTSTLRAKVTEFLRQVRGNELQQNAQTLLEWDDSLAFNVPAIDNDHRHIMDLTNALYRRMKKGREEAGLDAAFQELEEYTRRHFTSEEGIMRDHGYPGLSAHQGSHQRFITRLKTLYTEYRGGRDEAGVNLLGFLGKWWLDHIRTEDRAVATHIRSHRRAA
ncbi:bacteriohemerythrin [Pararhodospirillum oryzae]|uniref:Methyl-accepting chemotaxis protein n=1 Tax=Pararhodospirillum oryzae TaxID=478448 RepID=A0A512H9C9_9PROT|nr:bacteriohemerythrin [Pararhodospirillum oryzae]GEO82066.1 hypothetical protein ROR02_21970 [Pararhodospirillum oryzae]